MSCCTSVRCNARTLTVNSGTSTQMGNTQACGAHLLHVFRRRIDEGHVLSGFSHMRADVPAERTHAHNRYPWTH
jgi:hypothetical protein